MDEPFGGHRRARQRSGQQLSKFAAGTLPGAGASLPPAHFLRLSDRQAGFCSFISSKSADTFSANASSSSVVAIRLVPRRGGSGLRVVQCIPICVTSNTKSPNRTRFKHGDTPLSLPEYRPSGARLVRGHAQIGQGAEPNATGRVGADGETGDFKGLTLSNSGPVFRGFSSGKARIA